MPKRKASGASSSNDAAGLNRCRMLGLHAEITDIGASGGWKFCLPLLERL